MADESEHDDRGDSSAGARALSGRPEPTSPVPIEELSARNLAPAESDPLGLNSMAPPPPKQTGAISSGAFEISPASFRPPAVPSDLPPSTVIANAMGRNKVGLSLGAIAGIGAGLVALLILLSLLLFR